MRNNKKTLTAMLVVFSFILCIGVVYAVTIATLTIGGSASVGDKLSVAITRTGLSADTDVSWGTPGSSSITVSVILDGTTQKACTFNLTNVGNVDATLSASAISIVYGNSGADSTHIAVTGLARSNVATAVNAAVGAPGGDVLHVGGVSDTITFYVAGTSASVPTGTYTFTITFDFEAI